ncbi:hypothetical protein BC835DRAFT_1422912 [Cytidiella melzeri]|nr:hypothetical protein BC835DRAFT_1422912 [Cytidiella melzeri]
MNTDALILPTLIKNGYRSLHLSPIASFDHIETSNVMDYVGVDPLVCAWAPMLNRADSHATLLLSTMNWVLQSKEARAYSLAGKRGGLAPLLQQSATYLDTDLQSVAMSWCSNLDPKLQTCFSTSTLSTTAQKRSVPTWKR